MKRCLLAVLVFLLAGCGIGVTETTGVSASAPAPGRGVDYNDTDVMFLQMAVPQHEQGIEMAAIAEKRASRKEVRELAAAVLATQRDELKQIKHWLSEWNQPIAYDKDPAAHAGHGGMHLSDPAVVTALRETPEGPSFDSTFLTLLTGHQHGAVELARMEAEDGLNRDALDLADRMIRSRMAEIREMGKYLES